MKFEIEISESAEKSLEKIPKKDRSKLVEKIDALSENPTPPGSLKLRGHKVPLHRIRSGDYRVVYAIKNDLLLILIVEVGHRKEIYR